jgi:tryptophanyl-tRNA synthetase
MLDTTTTPTSPPSFGERQRPDGDLEDRIRSNPAAFRILTGDRPTGPLHIGHYFGTLENRVRLQRLGVELYVLIADYQTITDRDAPVRLADDVEGLVADYLAVGIDPATAVIFTHSKVAELNQLLLPFLSLVSVAELSRNPTVKEEIATAGGSTSALMFTYPVHQAADILFCRANLVPVGKDQLPHLELARTIARRFNERYSRERPYFAQPEALLSRAPLLLGLDGRKMGKSRGNSIPLAAGEDQTVRLIRSAKTDGDRRITYDPKHRPEVSNLLQIAALCLERRPEEIAEEIGDRGAQALKTLVSDALNDHLRPIRARRAELAGERGYLRSVLRDGNERACEIAAKTLDAVHELMHTNY